MYRCEICKDNTEGKKRKHILRRHDRSILREVAVCPKCERRLETGEPMSHLQREYAEVIPVGVTAPAPVPPPPPPKVNTVVNLGAKLTFRKPEVKKIESPKPKKSRSGRGPSKKTK